MWFFALAGSAVVPSFFLFWYIYSRDIHPEPKGMLAATFGLGAAVAIPVLIVALGLAAVLPPPGDVWWKASYQAFLQAAIPEEGFKFLVLMTFCWYSRHFDEPFDGVVYGATASLGFATLENILYVSQGGLGVAVLRAFTAVPGHAFCGVVMGYFVGRAKFAASGRGSLVFQGLLYSVILHGLYDLFLMTGSAFALLALPVLVGEVVLGILLIRRMKVDGFIPPRPLPGAAGAVPYPPYAPQAGDAMPPVAPQPYAPQPYAPQPYAPQPYPPPAPAAYWAPGAYVAPPPRSRGSALLLIFGALLGSFGALFALATVGSLIAPDPGGAVTMAELFTLILMSLGGMAGGIVMFVVGLGRRTKPAAPPPSS